MNPHVIPTIGLVCLLAATAFPQTDVAAANSGKQPITLIAPGFVPRGSEDVRSIVPARSFGEPGDCDDVAATELLRLLTAAGGAARRVTDAEMPAPGADGDDSPPGDTAAVLRHLKSVGHTTGHVWLVSVGFLEWVGILTSKGELRVQMELWSLDTEQLLFREEVVHSASGFAFVSLAENLTERGIEAIEGGVAEIFAKSQAADQQSGGAPAEMVPARQSATPTTLVQTEWTAYTFRFIAHYELKHKQADQARELCRTAQERAQPIVDRIPADALSAPARPAAARDAAARERTQKLLTEIDEVFESQLRRRLDALLTASQRAAAAGEPARPRPAVSLMQ